MSWLNGRKKGQDERLRCLDENALLTSILDEIVPWMEEKKQGSAELLLPYGDDAYISEQEWVRFDVPQFIENASDRTKFESWLPRYVQGECSQSEGAELLENRSADFFRAFRLDDSREMLAEELLQTLAQQMGELPVCLAVSCWSEQVGVENCVSICWKR